MFSWRNKAINEKILSSDSSEYQSEIQTVDAQESYNGGVLILVTGHLTGKDNVKRSFTQTFFLAPQEKGYFVLNDIFRYTDAIHNQQQVKNASAIAPEVPTSHEHGISAAIPNISSLLIDPPLQ